MANPEEWSVEQAVRSGIISQERFHEHTDEVMQTLTDQETVLLITKEGKIAAFLAPITLEGVVERMKPLIMEWGRQAEAQLTAGLTISAKEILE